MGFFPSGAWAELAAVPANSLAELPENVSFEQAATLPVAGLTALYALEKGGGLLGRGVLVTGVSGGAGHFAVQLARLSGARVVALVRREEHEELVRETGATKSPSAPGCRKRRSFWSGSPAPRIGRWQRTQRRPGYARVGRSLRQFRSLGGSGDHVRHARLPPH